MIKSYERLKKKEKQKMKLSKYVQDIINIDVIYEDGILR